MTLGLRPDYEHDMDGKHYENRRTGYMRTGNLLDERIEGYATNALGCDSCRSIPAPLSSYAFRHS
jgi:hypothetical protein